MSTKKFFQTIVEQSHRIPSISRETRPHLARPSQDAYFEFLAVNVPSTYQQGLIPDGEEPPWGLLRVVVTAREKSGFKAGTLDAHRLKLSPEEIAAQIQHTRAGVVGLNPTSVNVPEAGRIAEICEHLGIPYIVGGVHATLDPKGAQHDFPHAAAIVRGNGEVAIGEILSVILRNGEPRMSGIWYRGQLAHPETYAPRMNPQDIPMIRQDVYIEEPVYTHSVYESGRYREIREATLFATYGCPYECTFCSSPVMVNRGIDVPYMRPEISRILDEVKHAVNDLNANAIHFLDDMAFISGKNIVDFYQGVVDRGLKDKFIWRGLTKAMVIMRSDFNEEVMGMMKESGAWKIALGIESGNDEILRRIKKQTTTEQITQAVRKLILHGIQMKGFFILGFPGETKAQIEDTVRFVMELKDLGMTEVSIFQFKPYPGTYEYELLAREQPYILTRLSYLKRFYEDLDNHAKERAESHVWLPDNLRIAEIPSGEVRHYIIQALEAFYNHAV